MSDLDAAAAKLNVPEEILQRSAAARADAAGSDTETVLAAWAGGSAAPSSGGSAPEPDAEPEPEQVTEETPPEPATDTTVTETAAGEAPAPQTQQPAAAVAVLEPEEDIEPEPLRRRVRLGGRSASVVGVVLALLGWVFSAQFFLSSASVFGTEDERTVGLQLPTGRTVVIAMVISVAIGIAVAGAARGVPAHMRRGMRLRTSPWSSGIVGAVVGLLIGAIGGALIVGLGTPVETMEGMTDIPIIPAVVWSVLIWAAGGWAVAAAVQGLAVPEALDADERAEMEAVSRRLGSAFGVPVLAALAILALVLSMAFIFISFPLFAPVTGIVAAGSILAVASISASKPSMKLSRGDLFVAIAGIASVLALVLALIGVFATDEHGEEEGGEETATEEPAAEPTETTQAG